MTTMQKYTCPTTQLLTSRIVALTFVFQLTLTSLCLLPLTSLTLALTPEPSPRYHDYCIVGAGPAGLQLGYFLKQARRDYIVFERSNVSGHFFVDYPRHRKLISINKRYTGHKNKEFNLRHDWNSLLSHDESLLFRHYSTDMFPHADALLKYLNDYQRKLGIRVQFNTEMSHIHSVENHTMPDGVLHLMQDQHGNQYSCKVLIIATGMWKPNVPEMDGIELTDGYETMSLDPRDYEGKSVLILGRGNSAFEVADSIYGATNFVHMIGRSRVRLSWATHYVGDLRAVNNGLLDTYQLKSLDGLVEADLYYLNVNKTSENKLYVSSKYFRDAVSSDNFAVREHYDKILRCLGFTFDVSIFQNETEFKRARGKKSKYPSIRHNYEYGAMPGVFVAGTASHSLDWRKSAGGFIHGFRYTARALSRLLAWRYEGEAWPVTTRPIVHLLNTIVKRINEASGIYQMFQVLGDVFAFSQDGETFDHYEEFPMKLLHEFQQHTGRNTSRILVLMLEYGPNFSGPGKDIFHYERATGEPSNAHQSNFLHPKFYYYKQLPTEEEMEMPVPHEVLPRPEALHHVVEDFLTSWDGPRSHLIPLRHFLDQITGTDLRMRTADACLQDMMLYGEPSPACKHQFLSQQALSLPTLTTPQVEASPSLAAAEPIKLQA